MSAEKRGWGTWSSDSQSQTVGSFSTIFSVPWKTDWCSTPLPKKKKFLVVLIFNLLTLPFFFTTCWWVKISILKILELPRIFKLPGNHRVRGDRLSCWERYNVVRLEVVIDLHHFLYSSIYGIVDTSISTGYFLSIFVHGPNFSRGGVAVDLG